MSEARVQTDRIVDVWAQVGSQEGSYGSGYIIAPRLILTSLHVVAAGVPEFEDSPMWESAVSRPYSKVKIRLLQGRRWWACKVLWPSSGTRATFDAALLEIVDDDWRSAGELSRWGRPTVEDTRLTVGAIGFPSAQRRKDGTRDPERITGICNPITGMRSRHYQIVITDGPRGSGSQWCGMSGAAVLCNGLVMAVVIEYLKDSQGTRLRALPVERLFEEDQAFRATVHAATASEPILESIELAPLLSTPAPPRRAHPSSENFSPASLLRADAEVVRFRGRVEDLKKLMTWCQVGGGCSVRLLTGPGGQGKTRLARKLAVQLQKHGWTSGLLSEQGDVATAQDYLRYLTRPTLLVVDYAEARQEQVRILLNIGSSYQGGAPLRILLVARSRGDWWDEFLRMESAAITLVEHAEVDNLLPLEPTTEGRTLAYREALEDLANEFGWRTDEPRLIGLKARPPDFSHPRYAQALMVHMTALIPFLEMQSAQTADAQTIILAHEERYWSRAATRYKLEIHAKAQRHVIAALSLCSAVSQQELTTLLLQIRGLGDQPEDTLIRAELWLHDLYPPAEVSVGIDSGPFVGTLMPDRLAEYLIVDVFHNNLDSLIGLLSAVSERQRQHAIAELASAAAFDTKVNDLLSQVINCVPPLALAAAQVAPRSENPAPLVAAIKHVITSSALDPDYPGLWGELYRAIDSRSVVFAQLAVSLGRSGTGMVRLLTEVLESDDKRPLARSLGVLFGRLYNAGKIPEALSAARQEVEISRMHSKSGDDADMLLLAASLRDYNMALLASGNYEESLTVIEESVSVYRSVYRRSGSGLSGLGHALKQLSDALAWIGMEQEATKAAEESLRIREALAADDPNNLPSLMITLSALAGRRHAAGLSEDALKLSKRSIQIGERLIDQARDINLRDFAACVRQRAALLYEAGQSHEALSTDLRLIELRKEIARGGEVGYLIDLAWTWSVHAQHLYKAGLNEEALQASRQAIVVYQNTPQQTDHDASNVQQSHLAEVLVRHSFCLALTNESRAAYSFAQEAVQLCQRLAEKQPIEFAESLADALRNLALRALDMWNIDEAANAIGRAIDIVNALVMKDLHKYEPSLSRYVAAGGFVMSLLGDIRITVYYYALALFLAQRYEQHNVIEDVRRLLIKFNDLSDGEAAEAWMALTGKPLEEWIEEGRDGTWVISL